MSWFERIFSRRHLYDELSEEMREHIEEKTEQLMRLENLSRTEARQAALRAFGNPLLVETRSREVWHWPRLETLFADLKLAFRRLRRSPGFATTVLLTLAIGIGANTAVFSVVDSVLLKPLPYPEADRLVDLSLDAPGAGGLANVSDGMRLSASMYFTFSRHNQTFQSMGVWSMRNANVTGIAQPDEVNAAFISDGVLQTLHVLPVAGRWLSQADQDPNGAKTVMLSYGYWQRRFGGDRAAVGRTIQVDAQAREIIGVMPRGFRMVDQDFDLLIPYAFDPTNEKLAGFAQNGIARLRPGVSIAQADADIARLIPVWMDSWSNGPGTNPHYYRTWKIRPNFRPLKEQVIGDVGNVLWVVMATVGLVMLIACTNVANLLLVRAESRQMELSIRAALGASRSRLTRELLLESVLLGALGGIVSVGIAYWGLQLLAAIGPVDLPRLSEISLDPRSLMFALVLSLVSGLFIGGIPVLKYARSKALTIVGNASRTASTGRARQLSRNVLVVAQVTMALILLISATLMIRTFAALRNVEPGFVDAAHVETMSIWIPDLLAGDSRMVMRIQNDIADKLAAVPGASSVGFAAAVPMDGNDPNWDQILIEGKNYGGGEPPLQLYNFVSPGYFRTMGTRLVAGRDFTWGDIYNLRPRVIVSESFARASWGSASAAVGKRVRQFSNLPWDEVIGVVEDVRVHGVDETAPAIVYCPAMLNNPYAPQPAIFTRRFVTFVIRSNRAGNEDLIQQMQQAVWSVNAELPLASVQTMQQIYSGSMARTSFTLVMLAIAGAMALALSLIGIYGVISYAVSQRTREIGIRLALGAQKGLLRWMFVRSALVLTGMGVVIGLGGAAAVARLMRTLLFGVSPLDPISFGAVSLILALAAVVASLLPACRASAVNPVEALRAE